MRPLLILRVARLAWRALGRNKFRTFLTMLGIIIGVAAVITMVSLGQGAQQSVQEAIATMGSNVIYLYPGVSNQGGVRGGTGTYLNLKEGDVRAVQQQCPSLRYVSPLIRRNFQVVYSGQNWYTSVQGVDDDYFLIREWPLESGEPFSDIAVTGGARVCDIGQTVKTNLFPNEDPVGSFIRIRGVNFRVLGVMTAKGQTSFGQDQDDVILAPYTSVMKHLARTDRIDSMYMSATSEERVPVACAEITSLMRDRHQLRDTQDNDFNVFTQQETAEAASKSSQVFTLLLAGVASVSLLVGGIGIMNIMLVSVTERIREIGTRMAVGAHQSDILVQFFMEALVMSLFGGFLGTVLGVSGSMLASRYWAPAVVSVQSIVLAFTCSALIGLFFGFYPALKASQLDPIEALRHE